MSVSRSVGGGSNFVGEKEALRILDKDIPDLVLQYAERVWVVAELLPDGFSVEREGTLRDELSWHLLVIKGKFSKTGRADLEVRYPGGSMVWKAIAGFSDRPDADAHTLVESNFRPGIVTFAIGGLSTESIILLRKTLEFHHPDVLIENAARDAYRSAPKTQLASFLIGATRRILRDAKAMSKTDQDIEGAISALAATKSFMKSPRIREVREALEATRQK